MPLTDLTNEQHIEVLRRMWLIRFFEEKAIQLYGEGHYRGSTHPYIAQEATALGVMAALEPTTWCWPPTAATARRLPRGPTRKAMMAELLGKATGLCGGKGGSMHMSAVDMGFLGSNAIVAGHIAIAGGVALAQNWTQTGVVTVCFFGDGASCEGVFYETLNMAALWKLPLDFRVREQRVRHLHLLWRQHQRAEHLDARPGLWPAGRDGGRPRFLRRGGDSGGGGERRARAAKGRP